MNDINSQRNLHPCPCCGSGVISMLNAYEICDVCEWEDDPVQSAFPDYAGGANMLSLNQAQKAWLGRKSESSHKQTKMDNGNVS